MARKRFIQFMKKTDFKINIANPVRNRDKNSIYYVYVDNVEL